MRTFAVLLAVALLTPAPAVLAQTSAARELAEQRAALEPNSSAWWRCGVEQAVVELEFDLATALRTTGELLAWSQIGDPAGVRAARAVADLARAMLDGPSAVERSEMAAPAAGADSVLVAHEHLARGRCAWLRDDPAEALAQSLAGLRRAREGDDERVLLLALWDLHGLTYSEAPWLDERLIGELNRHSTSPAAARFEPWRELDRYWREHSAHSGSERGEHLAQIIERAKELGDRRTECMAQWERAVLASESKDIDSARVALHAALALARAAGWRRELALTHELLAKVAIEGADLDTAGAALDEALAVSQGRGMHDRDVAQTHLRLRLATERADEEQTLAANAQLRELRRIESQRHAGYAAVREPLFAAERERIALEERGVAERNALAEQTSRIRTFGLTGAVGVLGLGVVLALRSRRRLAQAKARLEEQVQRAERESTAREAAEARLRKLEHAESLGLVASGVAHDFNNLMVGVLGHAELLRESERDPERRRRLDVIAACGERAARLCSQLQAYGGDDPLVCERLQLEPLVRAFAPVLAAAAGAAVRVELDAVDAGLELDACRSQVEQALLNLVLNARDARASKVTLGASRFDASSGAPQGGVSRGEWSAREYVCIEVRDDGEGMPSQLLERIFDPFFSTRFPGRGLGLAVVIGVLRRHGGVAWVDSRPGDGSLFRLYFPAEPGGERHVLVPAERGAKPALRSAALNVLVVDDELDVRGFLQAALESRGHRVALTEDVAGALAALEALPPDRPCVALVDLTLPTCDGREIVLALRGRRPDVRCVLMSGHAATHLDSEANELRVEGRIAKPFAIADLEQALAQAADHAVSVERAAGVR